MALAAVFAGGVWSASALPAYPRPVVYTQSDGTQITIRIVGDEFYHYVVSEEGYTLTGGADGDYYYATLAADGSLIPTRVKARPTSMLTRSEMGEVASLQRGLKPVQNSALRQTIRMFRSATAPAPTRSSVNGMPSAPGRMATASASTTGDLRSLIILVETSDKKFSIANPQQAFTNLLNQKGYSQGGATGSAWDYYNDNSNGKFNPEFVVVGPYQVSNTAAYYAGTTGNQNVPNLVVEACRLADADGLDFTQFANEDGTIRDVFVFFAGYSQAEGVPDVIWPHRWSVRGKSEYSNVMIDGVKLDWYACAAELQGATGATMTGIGPFCHEFGHVLGWPDFYDTDYESSGGTSDALENYSLMSAGNYNNDGHTPPALTILERWMVGWAEPELLSEAGDYTLAPVWEDKGYLIPTNTENDYFLLEARALGGFKWDNYIGDYNGNVDGSKGMLVMHVDYTNQYQSDWVDDNLVNANPNHECAKLVRAVPGSGSANTPSLTLFPGGQEVRLLTRTSNANFTAWAGSGPDLSLIGITVDGQTVKMTARKRASSTDMGLVMRVNQFDAMMTWDESLSDTWELSWVNFNDATSGKVQVTGASYYLNNLIPGNTYEITLTPLAGEQQGKSQVEEFTTLSVDSEKAPRLNLQSTYSAGSPVALSLLDYDGEISQVEWYIDGELVEESYTTMTSGEHQVVAAIVDPNGKKEYLVKYVTIN